jgi:hypothetical protein
MLATMLVQDGDYLPFARSSLHRLPAELAPCSSPFTAGASFWSIFACGIAPNLTLISHARQLVCSPCAPSCAGIRRRLATPWIAYDLGRLDRTRHVVLPSSLLHAPSAAESVWGAPATGSADARSWWEASGPTAGTGAVVDSQHASYRRHPGAVAGFPAGAAPGRTCAVAVVALVVSRCD